MWGEAPALGELARRSAAAAGRPHAHVFTQAQRASFAAANQQRTAEAAVLSAASIRQALDQLAAADATLRPSHQEAARLRIEHPAASLAELAGMAAAPCTKDALAGRLRRVIAAGSAQAR
jgi:cell division protein WhiA